MKRTRLFQFTMAGAAFIFFQLFSTHGQAQLPPGMKLFETTRVADGVYTFRFAFHRNMFVVTDEGVIATDPINPKAAGILMGEIRKITDKPIKYLVYSHNHWDHMLGGKVFKEAGARIISHENCVKHFRHTPNPALAMPDGTFKKRYDIRLGGKTLELRYHGRNHGDCLITMRLPKERLMFIVDIVTPRRVAFRIMPDFYPQDWIESLKDIEKLGFDRVIPGHGPPVAPKSAVREQREYLEDLMAAVREARTKTQDPDKLREMIKLPKYEKWAAYNQWLPQNVERIWAYYHMGW